MTTMTELDPTPLDKLCDELNELLPADWVAQANGTEAIGWLYDFPEASTMKIYVNKAEALKIAAAFTKLAELLP